MRMKKWTGPISTPRTTMKERSMLVADRRTAKAKSPRIVTGSETHTRSQQRRSRGEKYDALKRWGVAEIVPEYFRSDNRRRCSSLSSVDSVGQLRSKRKILDPTIVLKFRLRSIGAAWRRSECFRSACRNQANGEGDHWAHGRHRRHKHQSDLRGEPSFLTTLSLLEIFSESQKLLHSLFGLNFHY